MPTFFLRFSLIEIFENHTIKMIEVFKTNVQEADESKLIVGKLLMHFPGNRINFDLSDCDRILRVEGENICSKTIMALMTADGYQCEILLD
jgi:hypothetical protein